MDKSTFFSKLSNTGQSTVEYVLLLGVLMTLTMSVLNSDLVEGFLGPDSEFLAMLKDRMEYSYRHGSEGRTDTSDYDSGQHRSYISEGGQTRIFLPDSDYP